MMDVEELLRERRADIIRVARAHGARRVRLFDSVARGEAGSGSDVDLPARIVHGSAWYLERNLVALGFPTQMSSPG